MVSLCWTTLLVRIKSCRVDVGQMPLDPMQFLRGFTYSNQKEMIDVWATMTENNTNAGTSQYSWLSVALTPRHCGQLARCHPDATVFTPSSLSRPWLASGWQRGQPIHWPYCRLDSMSSLHLAPFYPITTLHRVEHGHTYYRGLRVDGYDRYGYGL